MFFFGLFCIVLASCNNSNSEKQEDNKLPSKHSKDFNDSLDAVMQDYYALTESFVNWDSGGVERNAGTLKKKLNNFSLEEIKKDSTVAPKAAQALFDMNMKSEAIALQGNLTAKRQMFDSLTQLLYSFLQDVQYDEKKIYLQKCPMAFHDSIAAFWLSETDTVRNPYLGLHHPKYGRAMIDCGGPEDSIDFVRKK